MRERWKDRKREDRETERDETETSQRRKVTNKSDERDGRKRR